MAAEVAAVVKASESVHLVEAVAAEVVVEVVEERAAALDLVAVLEAEAVRAVVVGRPALRYLGRPRQEVAVAVVRVAVSVVAMRAPRAETRVLRVAEMVMDLGLVKVKGPMEVLVEVLVLGLGKAKRMPLVRTETLRAVLVVEVEAEREVVAVTRKLILQTLVVAVREVAVVAVVVAEVVEKLGLGLRADANKDVRVKSGKRGSAQHVDGDIVDGGTVNLVYTSFFLVQ